MSIFHVHKFKKAKDKWAIGHVVTTGKTNPYHDGLKDNCFSFFDANSSRKIKFEDFFGYMFRGEPKNVVDFVRKIQGDSIGNYKRELLFEKVRTEKYSQLPSRLKCLYASDSLDSINGWLKYILDNSKCHPSEQMSYEIVELSPSADSKVFKTQDEAVWGCDKLTKMELIERATSYWSANCGGKEELLLEGRFQVIKVF